VQKNNKFDKSNPVKEFLLLIKWAFCKIFNKTRQICLFAQSRSRYSANFSNLIRKNIDIIELITLESLCNRFGINISASQVIIRYPPKLLDKQPLLMFHSEITALTILAKSINAKKIFEIGTFEGNTAANLAYNVSDDTVIYTLDFPLYRLCAHGQANVKYVETDARAKSIVKVLKGDSLEFNFSPFYNQMDIMYIDGGKSYKCVLSDSENAYKCAKDGGFIIWHDFLVFDKYYSVVALVVFELCRRYHLKLYLIDGTRMVITKKSSCP